MEPMHFDPSGQSDQGGQDRRPRWSGRTKRVLMTATAGALLLGSGVAVGIAVTGGASAGTGSSLGTLAASTSSAVSPSAAASPSPGSSSSSAGSRCADLVGQLLEGNHLTLAKRLHALCTRPVLRLALVGGEHGEVTFNSKSGPETALFERGTVESDTGSAITVTAADGTTWTWAITSSTVARQDGSKISASNLTGDQVFVGGWVVNGVNDARLIRVRSTG